MEDKIDELWSTYVFGASGKLDVVTDNNVIWSQSNIRLVAQLVTIKPFNPGAMIGKMMRQWKKKCHFEHKFLGGKAAGSSKAVFIFGSEEDRQQVIDKGPWLFDNALVALSKSDGKILAKHVRVEPQPFWIKVWGIDKDFADEFTGRLFGDILGDFVAFDPYESSKHPDLLKPPIRIRVKLNPFEALPKWVTAQLSREHCLTKFPIGIEGLPFFCYYCGRMTHTGKQCIHVSRGNCRGKVYDDSLRMEIKEKMIKDDAYETMVEELNKKAAMNDKERRIVDRHSKSPTGWRMNAPLEPLCGSIRKRDVYNVEGEFIIPDEMKVEHYGGADGSDIVASMSPLKKLCTPNQWFRGMNFQDSINKGSKYKYHIEDNQCAGPMNSRDNDKGVDASFEPVQHISSMSDCVNVVEANVEFSHVRDEVMIDEVLNDKSFDEVEANVEDTSLMVGGGAETFEDQGIRVFRTRINESLGAGYTTLGRSRVKWTLPKQGCVKINIDGVYDWISGKGGLGIVVRNWQGDVLFAKARHFPNGQSALWVEAMALKDALLHACEQGWEDLEIESDYAELVNAFHQDLKVEVVADCKTLTLLMHSFSFVHIYREANGVANKLARLASVSPMDSIWCNETPSVIYDVLLEDKYLYLC